MAGLYGSSTLLSEVNCYEEFWSIRQIHVIGSYPIEQWRERKEAQMLMRQHRVEEGRRLFEESEIGLTIWPHLYPYYEWCETKLSHNNNRKSAKASFTLKILSEVLDYSMDFELLQFVYDRWLFTTITGAIFSARKFQTSAATTLAKKIFSNEYWRWHHRMDISKSFMATECI